MKLLKFVLKFASWVLGFVMLIALIMIMAFIIFKNIVSENTVYQVIKDKNIIENGITDEKNRNFINSVYDELDLKMSKDNLVQLINKSKIRKETDLYFTNIISKSIGLTNKKFNFSKTEDLQLDLINKINKKEKLNNNQRETLNNVVLEIIENSEKMMVDDKFIEEDIKVWVEKSIDFSNDSKYIIILIAVVVVCLLLIAFLNYNLVAPIEISGFVSLGLGIIYLAVWLLSLFLFSLAQNNLDYDFYIIDSVKEQMDSLTLSISIVSLIIGSLLIYLYKKIDINRKIAIEKTGEKSII